MSSTQILVMFLLLFGTNLGVGYLIYEVDKIGQEIAKIKKHIGVEE